MTWLKHSDTPPAPGEIDPVRLLCWFQMAGDSLAVPEDVMQYICDFDALDVQNLLVYGSNMMPAGCPHDSEMDAAPNNEAICRVKRGADGLWRITKVFTTAKESTGHRMGEVINYGYWDVPLGRR